MSVSAFDTEQDVTTTTDKPVYALARAHGNIPLSADPQTGPWKELDSIRIEQFPWYTDGEKQRTVVTACYDPNNIHILFDCEDSHIGAFAREANGAVCQDSCVEFFASPPGKPHYFNLEMNCCGDIHLGYGPMRLERKLAPPSLIEQIGVTTTVDERPKQEYPDDDGWVLQVKLPFKVINQLTHREITPEAGTQWQANFYRCGGFTDPQHACWSPIDAPLPDFHLPEYFGTIIFGE